MSLESDITELVEKIETLEAELSEHEGLIKELKNEIVDLIEEKTNLIDILKDMRKTINQNI